MDEKKRKEMEALLADHERWDNRELGASEEHLAVLSDDEQREIDSEIDEGLGLQHISIRLNKGLIEQLKQLAKLEGIGYQPLVRVVLSKYVKANEFKLDVFLSASEAADRADKLFARAVKLRSEIARMAPLSNERINQESDYRKTLSQAQTLFSQAIDNSKELVLIQHAKRRLAQIAEVCQQDLEVEQKKSGKKKKAV